MSWQRGSGAPRRGASCHRVRKRPVDWYRQRRLEWDRWWWRGNQYRRRRKRPHGGKHGFRRCLDGRPGGLRLRRRLDGRPRGFRLRGRLDGRSGRFRLRGQWRCHVSATAKCVLLGDRRPRSGSRPCRLRQQRDLGLPIRQDSGTVYLLVPRSREWGQLRQWRRRGLRRGRWPSRRRRWPRGRRRWPRRRGWWPRWRRWRLGRAPWPRR